MILENMIEEVRALVKIVPENKLFALRLAALETALAGGAAWAGCEYAGVEWVREALDLRRPQISSGARVEDPDVDPADLAAELAAELERLNEWRALRSRLFPMEPA